MGIDHRETTRQMRAHGGWMLLQPSQLTAPVPRNERLDHHLECEVVFGRRMELS